MFYLKYRPQTVSDLDSEAVRRSLTSILKSDNIPHAFLFTGPKGTGKTSTARILAKVLNAEENRKGIKNIDPSLDDPNVKAIAKGNSADVIEMDGASNRKIDDIRELIAQLKFAPISSKYKIYIIDEVHMLTKEAFNALLKSLEEPPSSTIFVLATTEVDMLPKTIISRCIRINFTKASDDDIKSMLTRVSKAEKMKVGDAVISFIAKHADGSFRDAAKTLELMSLDGDLSLETAKKVLGEVDDFHDLLKHIEKGDLQSSMQWCENHRTKGSDFSIILRTVLDELHTQLLNKNNIAVEIENEYNFSIKQLAQLIALLQQAFSQQKYSPIDSLPLELALVEFLAQSERKK